MHVFRVVLLAALLCAIGGCYHATIDTGLSPSGQVYHQKFASCWVFGLVPPKTITAMNECPNGVAKVETQLSFLDQLVGALTIGIYTPVDIKVTCAGGSAEAMPEVPDLSVAPGAPLEEVQKTFMTAAEIAVKSGQPIYVSY